jgi:hypothetical protein
MVLLGALHQDTFIDSKLAAGIYSCKPILSREDVRTMSAGVQLKKEIFWQ